MPRAHDVRYDVAPDLRLKPLDDLGCLLVFTPDRPRIHWLNAKSWLIFELCEQATEREVFAHYVTAAPAGVSADEVLRELRVGLKSLVANGIVREIAGKEHSTS
jgi:hypothetical protein